MPDAFFGWTDLFQVELFMITFRNVNLQMDNSNKDSSMCLLEYFTLHYSAIRKW